MPPIVSQPVKIFLVFYAEIEEAECCSFIIVIGTSETKGILGHYDTVTKTAEILHTPMHYLH